MVLYRVLQKVSLMLITAFISSAMSQTVSFSQPKTGLTKPVSTASNLECVVIQVQDDVITLSQFRRQWQEQSESKPVTPAGTARRAFVEEMIRDRLWIQKAHQLGITIESQEIARRIAKHHGSLGISRNSPLALWSRATAELLKERAMLLAPDVHSAKAASPQIAEHDVQTYFYAMKEFLATHQIGENPRIGESGVHLSEISFKLQDDPDAAQLAGMAQLYISAGNPFDKVAQSFSESFGETSGVTTSDVGVMFSGELNPSIWESVRFLEVGQVSETMKTQRGYLIFKVTDRYPPYYPSSDAARAYIIDRLKSLSVYVSTLRSKSKIAVDEACLTRALSR